MKILFLTHSLPHSQKTSNRLRQFNWLKYLSKKHQIFLVSFIDAPSEKSYCREIEQYCYRIETVLRNSKQGLLARCLNLFQDRPYLLGEQFRSKEMWQRIKALLKQESFDLIYTYSLAMAQYAIRCGRIPKILDANDCLTRNYLQQWRIATGIRNSALSFIDWIKMKDYEPKMFSKFDKNIFVNPVDQKFILKRFPGLPTQLISYGIDLDYFKPQQSKEDISSLIFTGTMDYPPNDDAVVYFCRNILPAVEKNFSSIKVYILGGHPSPIIKKIAAQKKNIILTGFIEDIRPFMTEATVFICPLRMGTGIKTKVLEAMAMAKPIVSTSLGAEGINAVSGQNMMIVDEPGEFALAVINLLKDRELRQKLGARARELAEKEHNWESLAGKINNLYEEVVNKSQTKIKIS